jgi:hypothetical protein
MKSQITLKRLFLKVLWKLRQRSSHLFYRLRDRFLPAYSLGKQNWIEHWGFQPFPRSLVDQNTYWISALAENYVRHAFDLLGSGRLVVKHGMDCAGLEGYKYRPGPPEAIQNEQNRKESERIRGLISAGYVAIDWHVDFKSGYRWSENTHYSMIRFGDVPGADIKVPWELARMQHLPVMASALGSSIIESEKRVIFAEIRNQILDFVSANPPRFGVNWAGTMDVAIRAVNLIICRRIVESFGFRFDPDFEEIFARSLYEHGLHIINNLEKSPDFRNNHYLANITGLLFVAANLARTPETDSWLAFAFDEFINEVNYQFLDDGLNFEASTCYHGLSAEMIFYGTALILGLPKSKRRFLVHRRQQTKSHQSNSENNETNELLGAAFLEKLRRIADATTYLTRLSRSRAPQIGDNDSGRLIKIHPSVKSVNVAEAKSRFTNLRDFCDLPDESDFWVENDLDFQRLAGQIKGLFAEREIPETLDEALIRSIRGQTINICGGPCCARPSLRAAKAFERFGLYILNSDDFRLVIRCGPNGQAGRGGHAHNDQLSFELYISGEPVLVDPGAYNYTALPEKRNLFRSTAMHNTAYPQGAEQNPLETGARGLFRLPDRAKAGVSEFGDSVFEGVHAGYGVEHTRRITIQNGRIIGVDRMPAATEKTVGFHFAPGLEPRLYGNQIFVESEAYRVSLESDSGVWEIDSYPYSPGYGKIIMSKVTRLSTDSERIHWSITMSPHRQCTSGKPT